MSFGIALSGLNAAQTDLNVTANNIANSATNGFKQSRSESRYSWNRRIRLSTSRSGRCQLSDENAYSVSVVIPNGGADSTVRRTAETPATWPASLG